jgi:hypothetical protein
MNLFAFGGDVRGQRLLRVFGCECQWHTVVAALTVRAFKRST